MKKLIILTCLILLSKEIVAQNVIRVTNGQNIQSLIDNNPANSVFLLDPGIYNGFTSAKKVTIIGSGFFNGVNTSRINGGVTFSLNSSSTSNGSIITGCEVSSISIAVSNVLVQKCRIYSQFGVTISDDTNNCIIKQCYIDERVYTSFNPSNFQIVNCLIGLSISMSNHSTEISGLIQNNTIGWRLTSSCQAVSYSGFNNGVIIRNNILVSPNICIDNNLNTAFFTSFNNNVFRQGNYSSNNNTNTPLANLTTLFTNSGGPDSQLQLAPTSPARGVGIGGVDCGAYGGSEPYVPSGTPTGPVIYELSAPTTVRQNEIIPVQIKAKIQN